MDLRFPQFVTNVETKRKKQEKTVRMVIRQMEKAVCLTVVMPYQAGLVQEEILPSQTHVKPHVGMDS